MNELIIEARPENMYTLLDFISREVSDSSATTRNRIYIAVDEIFTNVARYARPQKEGNATIRIAVENCVTIEFSDYGSEFDPLVSMLDETGQTDTDEIAGFGLHMAKNMMDSVEYRREENRNILTMKISK